MPADHGIEGVSMNRVEAIEQEIQTLSPQELADLREWFVHYDAAAWDRQIERDVATDRLEALASRALADHEAGTSREL
jgi:hypothetical protein